MAIVLNNVTSGYNLSTINSNFQKIEDYVNDKLLTRADTGVAGEAMMKRALDMNGNKILNIFVDVNDASSLLTVGVADSRYYNVSGDTLTGPMNANSQIISNLPTPNVPSQAVNKGYVDSATTNLQSQVNQTLRVPETSVSALPSVTRRKNKILAFDNDGNPLAVIPESGSAADVLIELSSSEEGMGTWLSTHVQDGVVTQNLHDFLNGAITHISPDMGFASLKECCEYASANNIELVKLPAGTFDVSEPINVSGTFRLEGAGIGKTIIRQLSSATDGVFNHVLNDAGDGLGYSDFTLQTQKAYSATNYGIRIDMRPQLSGTEIANRTRYRGYIRDIEVVGSYTRSDGIGFGVCIDLISAGWMDLERLRLSGCAKAGTQYDMQGVGILQRGDGKPVETRIMGVRTYNFEYGYLFPEYVEGVYLTESMSVNCKWGVVVSPVAEWAIGTLGQVGCYQFNVDQYHGNVSMGAVFISGTRYSSVTNIMLILDDHSQTSGVVGVHLRNGYCNTVNNIQAVFYNVNGTTGITRQALIVNGITDSFFENINARTASTDYENITHVVRLVNSAFRNRFTNVIGVNADTGISITAGCGNNSASNYRFQNVTTPIDDQAGDFNRGNADSQYVTFTPEAGSSSYTLTITPRAYFSRRPRGVSANLTSPTTLSFPVDVFYDYVNSTQTAVVLIIKPTASGNTLPSAFFGVSVNMRD